MVAKNVLLNTTGNSLQSDIILPLNFIESNEMQFEKLKNRFQLGNDWEFPPFNIKPYPMSDNDKQLKIFLVDDDEFCLNLYQQYLNKLGHSEVVCYKAGKTCLDNIMQRPDIIFLDYHMEDMNGIDVLHTIKQFDNEITVIFISGQEEIDIAVNALKYGAFDYITKSQITLTLLKTTIDRIAAEKGNIDTPSKKSFFGRMKNNLGM